MKYYYICKSIREDKKSMKYQNIREEELKNKITQDFFQDFDASSILKNIDFCVKPINKSSNNNLS
jgi:hypothetical protein